MKSGPPRAIGELLVSALPQLEDRLLVQRMRRAWSAVVGADVARRAQPQALVNGCLTIVVDNSPWLHELTLRAADLTEQLRARFPTVQTLRFSLGAAAVEEAAAETPSPSRRPRLSEDDTRAIDAAAAAISDPALAASARRLLARAWPPPPARGIER
jgi:hypothetical protein